MSNSLFFSELLKVVEEVGNTIRNDSFPSTIEPEQLRLAVSDYPLRKGKRLRPALLQWSCGLLGGDPLIAKFAAASVEVYHNWTLVHDDIIDDDNLRRGLPSTHANLGVFAAKELNLSRDDSDKFGRDFAILTGDVQQGWAMNFLLKSVENGVSPELTIKLSRRMQELVNRDLISGEALDVEFSYNTWDKVTSDQVEKMMSGKTGALLRYCAEVGAMIALENVEFDDPRVAELGSFANLSGLAFQLKDDWLGLFGDQDKLGKPIGSDLVEGKPTLLLLETKRLLGPERQEELIELLGHCNDSSESNLEKARALIQDSGAEKEVMRKAENFAKMAKDILMKYPDNKYRDLLIEWTDYLNLRKT